MALVAAIVNITIGGSILALPGTQVVAQGSLGASLAGNAAPLPKVADTIFRGAGGLLVLTATVSLVGFLQGELLGSSRLLYAMASNGFLPEPLAVLTE